MPFHEQLSPELIIAAYRGGYFPMPDPDTSEILWYNPDPRAIIPLDRFHISKSLRRTARKGHFRVTFDQDFACVVTGCATREPTWISDAIRRAYIRLFEKGVGHSVEVWDRQGALVGGLYGISQAGVFNAESMFSKATDASKIAMWALVNRLRRCGVLLLEVQFMTEHLSSMGAIEVNKSEYLLMLEHALRQPVQFDPRPIIESMV
jgi:leucyl/phenylalanyl-tRNA--protein transferase